ISDPIVYAVLSTTLEGYFNFDHTGSRGVEASMKLKFDWGHADLSWSYYNTAGKNAVDLYAVADHPEAVLGLPANKVTGTARLELGRGLGISSSVVFLGHRWGYLTGDGRGNGILDRTEWATLVDGMLDWRGRLDGREVRVGLGGYNLLGQSFAFVQPYNGS